MKTYYNLAYGSNMSTKRLFARLPNATHIEVATVTGYQLAYHKLGVDESGKCDAFYTGDPQDILYGVLYAFNEDEKAILDELKERVILKLKLRPHITVKLLKRIVMWPTCSMTQFYLMIGICCMLLREQLRLSYPKSTSKKLSNKL